MKAFVASLATLGVVSGQVHPGPAHVGIGNLGGGAHPNKPAHTTPGQPFVSAHPGPAHPCPAFVPCPAGRKRREAANLFSLNADYGPQVAQMTSKFAQGQFGNGPANLAAPIVPPAPARPFYPQGGAAPVSRATYQTSPVGSSAGRASPARAPGYAPAPAPAPARAAGYVQAAVAPAGRAAYAFPAPLAAGSPLPVSQAPTPVSNSYKLNTPIGPNTLTLVPVSQGAIPARAAPARPAPARAASYVQPQAPASIANYANYASIAGSTAGGRASQQRPRAAPRRAPAQAPRRAPHQPRTPPRFANYQPAPTPSRAPAPIREQGAYPEPEPEPVTRKPVGQRYPEAEPYIHDPTGDASPAAEPYVHDIRGDKHWGKKAFLTRKQQELEAQRLEAEAAQQAPLEYENEIEQPRGGQNYADYY